MELVAKLEYYRCLCFCICNSILADVALTFTLYLSTNPVQSIEKTFQLTRADKDLLTKPEYDVQVCFMPCVSNEYTEVCTWGLKLYIASICRLGVSFLMTRFPLGCSGHSMLTYRSTVCTSQILHKWSKWYVFWNLIFLTQVFSFAFYHSFGTMMFTDPACFGLWAQ